MTRDDAIMILAVLKAAYPHSFKDLTRRDGEAMVSLWQMQFADVSFQEVEAAVNALIATRTAGYSPTIGEVKEQLYRLHSVNELTEGEAWAMVYKALSNGYYGYQKEFDKLPTEVQRAVGRAEQLREWSQMETETVQSVVASNFMRSYRTMKERAKETAKLPESVRLMIGSLADEMKMLPE